MLVADLLPELPEDREALAARFVQVLLRDVPTDAITDIVLKVGVLLAEYASYRHARDEYLASEIWRDLKRVHDTADELLKALEPFLNASPLSPGGSGAFLLGMFGLGTAAPATWADPFVARLKVLRERAEQASADLYPHDGHGNPLHKHGKRVHLTRRAIELLPADVRPRTRNAFVSLVFDLAGEPQSKETIRQLVHRAKRDANQFK